MAFSIRPYRRFAAQCAETDNPGPFFQLLLAYCSGFGLLITLLLLSSEPVYAEWVRVSGNDRGDMSGYANPDTIRRKGEMVTMWGLFDYKTTKTPADNESYLSRKWKMEYDCDGERARLLTYTDFSDHMGNGKVVADYSGEGKWRPLPPDSIGKALLEFACGKK